jgi:hypothetical protein
VIWQWLSLAAAVNVPGTYVSNEPDADGQRVFPDLRISANWLSRTGPYTIFGNNPLA